MKTTYQIFSTKILNKISKDASSFETIKNKKVYYNTLKERFSSIKAAQKRTTEILKKGEFTTIECDELTPVGSIKVFVRYAEDLKKNNKNN